MKGPSLAEYAGKRNFGRTTEPGPVVARKAKSAPMFVIQKHDASHLHYDFRLEVEGVLKSWAVPKGVPTTRGEKRLAMQVEDHPFSYAEFEGIIPEGNYGAGTVMVWDIGTFEVSGDDPAKAIEEGKVHLTLHGKKLEGEWTLVRIRHGEKKGKQPWLLLKSGESMKPLSAKREDQSVLSGRSMRRIAGDKDAEWESNRPPAPTKLERLRGRRRTPAARAAKAPEADAPEFVEPMKSRLTKEIPKGKGWVYEIKFDGIRALAIKNGKDVRLYSRLGNDVTGRFPEVVDELRAVQAETAVIDGEVVALEKSGRSSFQLLQMSRMPGQKRPPICFYVFDLLRLEDEDLTGQPLHQRKETLQSILPADQGDAVRFSASLKGDPKKLLQQVRDRGLEGLIGKQENSLYEIGRRSRSWIKIKVIQQQEFVIGGYTEPQGSRQHFGSLLVGFYDKGKLRFASKVGTGFDHALLKSLFQQFQKLKRDDCPFVNLPEKRSFGGQGLTAGEMRRCTWLEPKLVCEVIYNEWTRDDHLRQPVFAGLREDKRPEEVVRETATAAR